MPSWTKWFKSYVGEREKKRKIKIRIWHFMKIYSIALFFSIQEKMVKNGIYRKNLG